MATSVTGIAISELGAANALTGAELVPIVQDDVTRRTTVADIVAMAGIGGIATAALPAGTTSNLVVADIETIQRLALTLAGDATLTGIVPPAVPDGRRLMIINRSAFVLTLPTDTTSAAANRFASNGDLIVPPLCGAEYVYDGTNQRWVKT